MPGPHPSVAATRVAVRSWLDAADPAPAAVARGGSGRLVVAVSGGADSLALCAAAVFEAHRAGLAVHVVTVDHGLQPGSAHQAQRVVEQAAAAGADRVDVRRVLVEARDGPEADARTARRRALREYAGDDWVLLGHTLDDQAETVLLGLGRGSGVKSLAGMAASAHPWGRPLLGLRRATTTAACTAQGLQPWLDPHNADPRFTRPRLRHEVLPLLEDVLGGGVAEALARTAGQLHDLDAALDDVAAAELATYVREGDLDVALGERPRAIRVRVLVRWLAGHGGGGLNAAQLGAVDALLSAWHGQGAVALPGSLVERRHGRLTVRLQPNRRPDPA